MEDVGAEARSPSAGGNKTLADPEVASISADDWDSGDEPVALERGANIGRYTVLSRVGMGGMGVVFAAYDPDLDRRVAIKLLHGGAMGTHATAGHQRLVREARAMAQLNHPNAVTVHDIGMFRGRVYIAMEFVEGKTLGAWMKEHRGRREVLAAFGAAAHGLAAAHRAGLVHRDFKPDNVMVGDDGRIRVMDFGLARPTHAIASEPELSVETPSRSTDSDPRLTRTGAIMGTPAYMAPEQHLGLPTDARSDQFSFCVALYEGLYGTRPFVADTMAQLAIAVTRGEVPPPPKDATVPGWVRAIVVRGLAADPARRWPDMDALVAALGRDPSVARRRTVRRIGVAAGVVLCASAAWSLYGDAPGPCAGAERRLDGIWDDERRGVVAAQLRSVGTSWADTSASRAEESLDDWATQWVEAHTDACEDTNVRHEQSAEALDLRLGCLSRRLEDLRALVDVLATADHAVAARAVEAAGALPPLSPCADVEALRAQLPPPTDPTTGEAVRAVRETISRSSAAESAGRLEHARTLARDAVTRSEAIDYVPVRAEALERAAAAELAVYDYREAVRLGTEAFFAARRANHDDVAVSAATSLVIASARGLGRIDEAMLWSRHAEADLDVEGAQHEARAEMEEALATVADLQGEYAVATEHLERALALRERSGPADHPRAADNRASLAQALVSQAKYADARAQLERSLATLTAALGEGHPKLVSPLLGLGRIDVALGDPTSARTRFREALEVVEGAYPEDNTETAKVLVNLGVVLDEAGDPDSALGHYHRALAIFERTTGLDHADVAPLHNNLGTALLGAGKPAEAREHLQRALSQYERTLGDRHPFLATLLANLGRAERDLGDVAGARARLDRALAIREQSLGPDHPDVARVLMTLGEIDAGRGANETAQLSFERALGIYEQSLGSGHPDVAQALQWIGEVLVRSGRAAEAIPRLERAIAIRLDAGRPRSLGVARFDLARALVKLDRPRALEVAALAREAFVAAQAHDDVAALDSWTKSAR